MQEVLMFVVLVALIVVNHMKQRAENKCLDAIINRLEHLAMRINDLENRR